jgi:peptidyl-prolyl cis-trans isomerase D
MGVLGWVLLGILCIAFAFFGLNSYLQSNATNYAAEVNDVEISPGQHQRAYLQIRNRMQEMLGTAFDPAMFNEEVLKANALNQLMNEELVLQAAESEGMATSEQLVAARIAAIEAFQEDGAFSKERYKRILGLQGMSPGEFEWRLRRELMANQFKSGILQTAAATQEGLNQAFLLEGQQRRFSYLMLPIAGFADQIEITDADIERYYEENSETFMTPERVRVQYLELEAARLETVTQVDEQALQALYEDQAEKYVVPEERRARHILFQLAPDADDASVTATREQVDAAVGRLEAGESFETLAKELSDDPGSAANGGDLGFFSRGVMTAEFENVAFELNSGERSEPVRSQFGFHIIEIVEIKPEQATPLSEVRDELVDQLLSEERSELFYDSSETLSNLAFEQPDSLQAAADALGLEIAESDWFSSSGGAGIAEHGGIVETAFSEDVLLNGNNSAAIEIGEDHVVVLRILEHQEAARQALDEVREQVRELASDEQARALAEEQGKGLLSALQDGSATLDSIAEERSLQPGQTPLLGRNAGEPDNALVRQVFTLPRPSADSPVYGGFMMRQGDYALVALDEVKDGDLGALPEASRKQAWQAYNRAQGTTELAVVLKILEEQATIRIPGEDESQ